MQAPTRKKVADLSWFQLFVLNVVSGLVVLSVAASIIMYFVAANQEKEGSAAHEPAPAAIESSVSIYLVSHAFQSGNNVYLGHSYLHICDRDLRRTDIERLQKQIAHDMAKEFKVRAQPDRVAIQGLSVLEQVIVPGCPEELR